MRCPHTSIFIFQLLFNVFIFQFWKNAFQPVNAELLPGFLASIRAASPVHTGNQWYTLHIPRLPALRSVAVLLAWIKFKLI